MSSLIKIIEGMSPAEYVNALNNNFLFIDKTYDTATIYDTEEDSVDLINGNIETYNSIYPISTTALNVGSNSRSFASAINNMFTAFDNKQTDTWKNIIIADHKRINVVIPEEEYESHYRSRLESVLSSTYEDDETTGYLFNTYRNRHIADFFLIVLFEDTLTASEYKVIAGGTYRQDIEGKIYNTGVVPAHTYLENGTWIISTDTWDTTTSVRLCSANLIKYIPAIDYLPSIFEFMLVTNKLEGDLTNYVVKNFNLRFELSTNYFTGQAPRLYQNTGNSTFKIDQNCFTSIDISNSIITSVLSDINLYKNNIDTASLDALFVKLNTYFTSNAPIADLSITCNGYGNGLVTGVIEGEVWSENADIVGLRAAFTSAGYTLTLTYNSDETFSNINFGEKIAILTFDDTPIQDLTFTKPILDLFGIKGTLYCIGNRIGTTGYLTSAQLQDFVSNGWDVQCHSYSHQIETDITEEELRAEMTNNTAALISAGIASPEHHAYPTYANNESVQGIVSDYRLAARAGEGGFGTYSYLFKNSNTMALPAIYGDVITYLDTLKVKTEINGAAQKNAAIIFSLHSPRIGYGYNSEQFTEMLDHLINVAGYTVMTMKGFWDEYGGEFA